MNGYLDLKANPRFAQNAKAPIGIVHRNLQ